MRNKERDQQKPAASSTGWAGRAGEGQSPRGEMLPHPSVPFLPSVFPRLSPSGLPCMPFWALLVSQILRAHPTWETNQFN